MTDTQEIVKSDKKASAVAIGHGIELNTTADVMNFARFVYDNRLAPSSYRTPQDVFIGVIAGMEHGFTALQSLSAVAVINNKPCLYGDSLPALINRSGKCAGVKETIEGSGDKAVYVCEVKRKDQDEPYRRTFSVEDAKRAGLWGKAGPWKQYPQRMLQMRARSWAFRDAFADVLGGFGVVEEWQDVPNRGVEHQCGASADTDPLLAEATEIIETPETNDAEQPMSDEEKQAIIEREAQEAASHA